MAGVRGQKGRRSGPRVIYCSLIWAGCTDGGSGRRDWTGLTCPKGQVARGSWGPERETTQSMQEQQGQKVLPRDSRRGLVGAGEGPETEAETCCGILYGTSIEAIGWAAGTRWPADLCLPCVQVPCRRSRMDCRLFPFELETMLAAVRVQSWLVDGRTRLLDGWEWRWSFACIGDRVWHDGRSISPRRAKGTDERRVGPCQVSAVQAGRQAVKAVDS